MPTISCCLRFLHLRDIKTGFVQMLLVADKQGGGGGPMLKGKNG